LDRLSRDGMNQVTSTTATAGDSREEVAPGSRARLVLLSFLMLFVELALIRWTGSNVVHLSYFSNFVLLGSFLGIGIGFLRADKPHNLFPYAPVALTLLVAFVRFFPVEIQRSGSDLLFFGTLRSSGPPRELVLAVIFVTVAAAMAFIAEGVARTFVTFEPLEAYRLDILGSIAGIVGFSALSFLRAPPLAWGVVVGIVFLLLYRPRSVSSQVLLQAAAIIGLVVILGLESFASGTSWSPYYKVTVREETAPFVRVNGVPHQALFETSENPPVLYTRAYERIRPGRLDDVLVIGAGGGNDVALALEHGARHVDAVEIDPRLYEIGTDLHPDRPYDDARVDVHIDDGRAFLERTDRRYDLILFALPDSLTLVSGQSSLRLESYLFTQEAIESAREHLKPQGAFAMYNYYLEQWLVDRLANTLDEAYGRPPCVDSFGGEGRFSVLVNSDDPGALRCDRVWEAVTDPVPEPATDDHPFPYLQERSIPLFYLVTIALILAASLVAVRVASGRLRRMVTYVDLFFMGAAFLLLETKSVVQFALLFGTTWFVNALTFTGILLSVLAAVEVSRRVIFRNPPRLYAALLVALLVAWAIPLERLLSLPVGLRFVAAVVVAFTPIFLANLVFAQRFKDVSSSAPAFGANLLGAMVGGLLEYGALLVGYRALLVVVAVLYGLAFVFGRRHLRAPVVVADG
jgi:Spermine/spermidine synthase domain